MKKIILAMTALSLAAGSCTDKKTAADYNPLLTEYKTPFGVPPFEDIKPEHYHPAFLQGMEEEQAEIKAICENADPPTFENTIAAMDQSGKLLRKVRTVFGGLSGANSNDVLDSLNRVMSPLLSKHGDDIRMNPELFARVRNVYEKKETLGLDKEQSKLLEEIYKGFVRGGANLSPEQQEILRKLNSEIALLQINFTQNMRRDADDYKLAVDDEQRLAGLPEAQIAAAEQAAKAAGLDGKWVFTLANPSALPFLQYVKDRNLREKLFNAYINRGNNNNKNDNKEIIKSLVAKRLEKANLMGYNDFATFALEERMAKTPEAVYDLLNQLWEPAAGQVNKELQDIIAEKLKEKDKSAVEGWDWRYYAEKAKKSRFALDENEIRPYLQLENVRDGAFHVAKQLYGITFGAVKSLPLPHPDAEAFECKDADGTHLGILYMDYFPRKGKRSGAWCGTYRSQTYSNGKRVAPVVTIVCNFSEPASGLPALLSPDEANTLFHEFGHALHNLFKDVHYYGVSGVPRDFVELPSQIMEHWVFEPQVLKAYARHFETGEVIPDELIAKLDKSGKYGQGFATSEYLAASTLDMAYHTFKKIPANFEPMEFEKETLGNYPLLSQIPSRYRSTYFNHTMGGGYTAGYYSYIWSEVLDCDAYQAFVETGDIFNKEVAGKFRRLILTPGGIDDAMDMYINFRGRKPEIGPLLSNRGLK